jgi:ribosomal-protein-alanine N-acetyltransferase
MFEDILYEIEHEARNQEEEHYKFFVAEDAEGHVAGYAVLNRAVGEGQLLDIAVRKASRGKGIGDMLMSALVGYHRDKGDKLLMLEVRKSNTAAKSLYEKYGFAESGTRKNYYTHPTEDAVLMDLRLEK